MAGRELLAGVIVNISSLAAAMAMGWISPIIPVLTSPGDDNPTGHVHSEEDLAWIGSILAIGALVASFPAGYFANRVGRKTTLIGGSLSFGLAYLLMIAFPTTQVILLARFLQGIGVGVSMTVQAMYIGEIATAELRGKLGSLMNFFMTIGFLLTNSIGPYLPFRAVQAAFFAFPCLFQLTFLAMPESPHYLLGRGREEAAVKSLTFLRRAKKEEEVSGELEEIRMLLVSAQHKPDFAEFMKPCNRKALLICGFLIVFQQLSGVNAILFFASPLFTESSEHMDPAVAVIILCAVQAVAAGIIPFVADVWGRRFLLLVSFGMATVCLFLFALCKFGGERWGIDSIVWIPLGALIGYLVAFCLGMGSMPWALISEMFAPNIKPVATAVMTCIAWLCTFLVTRSFQAIISHLGTHWMFFMFGGCAAAGFMFTWSVVFETKGLSLGEIQRKLAKDGGGGGDGEQEA